MHRLADQPLHRRHFLGGRLHPLGGRLAHHIAADAGMADQRADVDAALLAERIQIVADRFPGHVDPGLQHRQRDLFRVGEEFEIPLAVAGPNRGDDLAALADDDRGVAVVHPRAAIRVPHRLRVEMGVMIDKAGRDDPPFGVDRALGGSPGIFADPDDLAVLHRHVRRKCRLARAVDDAPVFNEQIIRHDCFSSLPRSPGAWGRRCGPFPTGPCVTRPFSLRKLREECYASAPPQQHFPLITSHRSRVILMQNFIGYYAI